MIDTSQIRMAKAALRWSNGDLAKLTGLHKNTISRAEAGTATRATIALIQQTFEAEGVEFRAADDHICVCLRRHLRLDFNA